MKKFNWGTGLAIVIVLFLVISIGRVVLIHILVDYDLVEEEYYDAEIKYQEQINRIKRTEALPEQLQINLTGNTIEFKFPSLFNPELVNGNILFYKPSDDLLDKKLEIKLNEENKTYVDTKELSTGLWKIKVEWAVNDVTYYNEESMMVP